MLQQKPTGRRVLIAAWVSIGFGIITSAGMFFISQWIPSSIPLPLGQLESVAVDSRGRVYCASAFYHRIQVYSPDGEYLRGWPVSGVRNYDIRVNQEDELEVLVYGETVYRYSSEGELLEARTFPRDFEPDPDKANRSYAQCVDADGRVYSVRLGLIYPHVTRRDKDGSGTTVVAPPRLGWFIMGPLPAFAYCFIGAALYWIGKGLLRRGSDAAQPDADKPGIRAASRR